MKRKTPIKERGTTKRTPHCPARTTKIYTEIDYTYMRMYQLKKLMTQRQIMFCHYYIRDWNATKAALKAGYSPRTAASTGGENTKKPVVKEYIKRIQQKIEEEVGISKISMLEELKAIATSKVIDLYDGNWITQKDFEILKRDHPEITSAIQEVSTKTVYATNEMKEPEYIEYVKIKMYDKQRAIESIFKAMGWNEPDKLAVTLEQPLFPDVK